MITYSYALFYAEVIWEGVVHFYRKCLRNFCMTFIKFAVTDHQELCKVNTDLWYHLFWLDMRTAS